MIGPSRARLISAARFRELLASAPPVDDEFARDLAKLRADQELPENPWPS